MKAPLKILKSIGLVFGSLVSLLIVAVLAVGIWVYTSPAGAWRFVESHFLPKDLKITWQDIHFRSDRTKGLNWDLDLSFDGLSIVKGAPEVQMTFDSFAVSLNATVFYPRTEFKIKNFEVVSKSPVSIKTEPSTEPEKPLSVADTLKQINSYIEMARSYQDRFIVEKVNIDLPDFRYASGTDKPILASLILRKPEANSKKIFFDLTVRDMMEAISFIEIDGSGDLSVYNTSKPFFQTRIKLRGEQIDSNIPLSAVVYDGRLTVDSNLNFNYKLSGKWLGVKPELTIAIDKSNATLNLKGDVTGIPGPITKLNNLKVDYKLPLDQDEEWMDAKGHFLISAPIPIFVMTEPVRKRIEVSCKCKMASTVNAKVEGDLWISRLLEPTDPPDAAIAARLEFDDIVNSIFAIHLAATVKVIRQPDTWLFEPTLDSTAHISSFKEMREILRASRIMIPAPFAVMDGVVDFSAKSPVNFESKAGQFSSISAEAKLSTALKSSRQDVKVDSTLNLKATPDFKSIHVDVGAMVDAFQVELPPLDPMRGLPRLVRDSRIQLEPIVVSKNPSIKMTFALKVQTTKKAAIRLLFPLASPYVPISVNYEKGTESEKGYIQIEPFKISYLKRVVFVDSMRINLDETADADFPIDGRFHVQQTDYKVNIRVTGTTQNPNIDLSSDPYLERADIVSVLLFDRTRENLVGGDAETSGNAQAAMADKAVGLFGLWAFASTPIRSVSYNSVTKVYSATIVLGDGLTAGIGTSLDQATSFEIRKRLSKRWVIATSWAPSETSDQSGEVVLQWEKRY